MKSVKLKTLPGITEIDHGDMTQLVDFDIATLKQKSIFYTEMDGQIYRSKMFTHEPLDYVESIGKARNDFMDGKDILTVKA